MYDRKPRLAAIAGSAAALALTFTLAMSSPAAHAKIVCWKDKSGKVVGCGDKVPPEFQSSATKELDSRGVTRRTTESVNEANERRARETASARTKADEDRKLLDQKRQDTALLETYSNEKEIDLKRDRDLQNIDLQLEQLESARKGVTQRYNEARSRSDSAAKNKKPLSPALKQDLTRATADKQRIEQSIDSKQKEREALKQRFAEYKKRYNELKSGVRAVPPSQSPVAVTNK